MDEDDLCWLVEAGREHGVECGRSSQLIRPTSPFQAVPTNSNRASQKVALLSDRVKQIIDDQLKRDISRFVIRLFIFQIQAAATMTAKVMLGDPHSLDNRISAMGKLDHHNSTEKKILLVIGY